MVPEPVVALAGVELVGAGALHARVEVHGLAAFAGGEPLEPREQGGADAGRALLFVGHEIVDVERSSEREAFHHAKPGEGRDSPVLLDSFLQDATEVDVDVLCDSSGDFYVAGIMEHIEEAGVHSGDSACSLPPFSLSEPVLDEIRRQAASLARALNVIGLMNVQFAVKDDEVYIIEVNPRASRTVPFVAKATGVPIAKVAARLMAGELLSSFDLGEKTAEIALDLAWKDADAVYLSFDIDGLDPSVAPGTGTPEPGGLSASQGLEIIRGLYGLNLVGCDLVEVAPEARPPVCRIMDYGKYRYDKEKKEKEARKKQHNVQMKTVRIKTANISDHDLEYRLGHIREFIGHGNRVKVSMRFFGRMMAYKDRGREVMEDVAKKMSDVAAVDQLPQMEGREMSMILRPV